MNNSIYLVRNKGTESKLISFIKKYNLETCFEEKNEKVLKSENVLMLIKKKYAFIHFFFDSDNVFFETQQFFRK